MFCEFRAVSSHCEGHPRGIGVPALAARRSRQPPRHVLCEPRPPVDEPYPPDPDRARLCEPLPGGAPRTPIRRGDLLEIQAREVGHADGHVAPLQGREEFFADPQCPFGLGLGKERDALVIQLQRMVDDVSEQVGSLIVGNTRTT